MVELYKKEDKIFKEIYEGINGDKRVVCILDNNCVRYMKFVGVKRIGINQYENGQQERCFKLATNWINR
jgi:hypothetical protein